MPAPRPAAIAAVLLIGLLTACGAASPAANFAAAARAAPAAGTADGAAPQPGAATTDSGTVLTGVADLADRKIVKTGEITVEVPNVGAAVGIVRAMALDLGGYVGDSSAGEADQAATLTLRFPAARFDDALQRLHAMDGTVIAEATREEDVTSSVVDLQARIDNLQASEEQYRTLLGRAEKIDDILSVQQHLDDVQGQIEQLTAQLKLLSGQADLSTLTVTLTPRDTSVKQAAAGWDPGSTLDKALAALVSVGQALGTAGIWLAVVGLPILIVLAILALFGRRFGLRLPRRRASPPSA